MAASSQSQKGDLLMIVKFMFILQCMLVLACSWFNYTSLVACACACTSLHVGTGLHVGGSQQHIMNINKSSRDSSTLTTFIQKFYLVAMVHTLMMTLTCCSLQKVLRQGRSGRCGSDATDLISSPLYKMR